MYNREVIHFARNKQVDNEKKTKEVIAGAELWLMQENGEIVGRWRRRESERADEAGRRVLGCGLVVE